MEAAAVASTVGVAVLTAVAADIAKVLVITARAEDHSSALLLLPDGALPKEAVEKEQGFDRLVPFDRLRAYRCCKIQGFLHSASR
jgi:hypothetical protein